jgi:hypothetical protein
MKGGPVRLIIFIVIIALACVDLGFVTFGGTTLSISAWMSYVGIRSPFIAFICGCCTMHFWPMGLTGLCQKCGWDLTKEVKNGSK